MTDNPYTGSSFDDFLQEEDLYEEVSAMPSASFAIAIKRVLARQLEADRKKQGSVSRRLRLAASVVGRQLRIELV
ncbi:MAG: hypothetical protein AAFQ23_05845 [Cyanobacteria bacterium J06623_1]